MLSTNSHLPDATFYIFGIAVEELRAVVPHIPCVHCNNSSSSTMRTDLHFQQTLSKNSLHSIQCTARTLYQPYFHHPTKRFSTSTNKQCHLHRCLQITSTTAAPHSKNSQGEHRHHPPPSPLQSRDTAIFITEDQPHTRTQQLHSHLPSHDVIYRRPGRRPAGGR